MSEKLDYTKLYIEKAEIESCNRASEILISIQSYIQENYSR